LVDEQQQAAARAARLSERQKAILRLVGEQRQSKEIARELGIGRRTVDKHIAAAMVHLGVPNRREAARALAIWAGERFPPEPRPLSETPLPQSIAPNTGDRWRGTVEFAETQAPLRGVDFTEKPTRRIPFLGGRHHDLTTAQRIGWMMALPFLIAFALGFFLLGFSALSELGRAIHRLFN
jgi:DNA-binding CsgD family transcriptional regulator